MRHAVLTPFFGQLRDRFATYHEPLPIAEKLRRAASIPGVEGVELIFPDEVRSAAEVRRELDEVGLDVAAVNVNVKGEARFRHGALSSPDAGVRAAAVQLLCEGKRLAASLGVPRVTCAPLADGYDYPFQVDYRRTWTRLVDAVGEANSFMPEITLHLEHKPAEPRTRGLLDVPAKVLLLCRDVGGHVGITFNTGHAACGGGLPAAVLADVLAARVPYYIHFCDATAAWDWDLQIGTQHPWQWAEVLFWLRRDGYDGWITADTFPVRQDACAMFAANLSVTSRICAWIDERDAEAIERDLSANRALPMLQALEGWFRGSAQ
jgi:xylose isomerase